MTGEQRALQRAAEIARSEGKGSIFPSHLRRAERELGVTVKIGKKR